MAHPSPIPPRFTYGDYVGWLGDERWELIEGEARLMSPAPSREHQRVVLGLATQIENFLRGGPCEVYVAPFDVRLPEGAEADGEVATVVQPDVVVVCDPSKLDAAGCRGAPDWVIEVLSPATAARDTVRKRALYERHGVREYWIVDPEARAATLLRLESPGRFGEPRSLAAGGTTSPAVLPDLAIDWTRVFAG